MSTNTSFDPRPTDSADGPDMPTIALPGPDQEGGPEAVPGGGEYEPTPMPGDPIGEPDAPEPSPQEVA
jgi:hypothetical protein